MPELIGLKLLVVEDDPQMARAVELILGSRSCKVSVAPTAQSALDLMETHEFDLIILDVMLREMDGYELLREMNRRFGVIAEHIIMMSALQSDADLERAQQAGIKSYVTKPFTADDLTSLVKEHLAQMPVGG
jgi:DNA-binding response OmpR family regulator